MPRLFALAALLILSGCGAPRDDLSVPPEPIGDFRLGYAISVAPDPTLGPFSRRATAEEWNAAMRTALQDRFSRFAGDEFHHIAVAVEGYVLAQPGIPVVYTPKSVLIFSVTFYRDATATKLNPEPIQITVFEPCCTAPFLGSGLTRTREEQLEGLAFSAARAVERTMRENPHWFGGAPSAPTEDPAPEGGRMPAEPAVAAPGQVALAIN